MAVIEVRRRELSPDSGAEATSGEKPEATVLFYIVCDSKPAYLDDLLNADDGTRAVSNIGDPYKPGDPRLCKTKSVKPKEDGPHCLMFVLTANFEVVDPGWQENPLLRKDTYKFGGSKETEGIFMTEEDTPKPITTPAGEPFEKLPERTTGAFKLTIEGYRNLEDAATLIANIKACLKPNAINDGSVTVRGLPFGEGSMKLIDADVEPVIENGVSCLKCRWELDLADDWDLHLDARGFWEVDDPEADPLEIYRIVKGDPPQRVTKPWPLDADGIAKPNPDDTPASLTFKVQPSKDFSVFAWTTAA